MEKHMQQNKMVFFSKAEIQIYEQKTEQTS